MSFEALLTQISYKPGWRFEFHPPANVELRVATIDSTAATVSRRISPGSPSESPVTVK